jgi:hypothetical protein
MSSLIGNDPSKLPAGLPASMAQHGPLPTGSVSDAEIFPLVAQLYSLEQVEVVHDILIIRLIILLFKISLNLSEI